MVTMRTILMELVDGWEKVGEFELNCWLVGVESEL
jgi:hypothetical protein